MVQVKFIRADWIMLTGLVLMIATHSVTLIYFQKQTDGLATQKTIEAYIELSEQNPLAALVLKFSGYKFIYSYVLVPSLLIGAYWFVRQKYLHEPVLVEVQAMVFCSAALINFFNDAVQLAHLLVM